MHGSGAAARRQSHNPPGPSPWHFLRAALAVCCRVPVPYPAANPFLKTMPCRVAMQSFLLTRFILAFLALSGPASADVSFINPPPPAGLGKTSEFGSNPAYLQDSAISVAWTETGDNDIPFSVVVLQVDYSRGTVDIPGGQAFEYVIRQSPPSTKTHPLLHNITFLTTPCPQTMASISPAHTGSSAPPRT